MDSSSNSSQNTGARKSRSRSLTRESIGSSDTVNETNSLNKKIKLNSGQVSTPIAEAFLQDYALYQDNNNNAAPIYLPKNIKNDFKGHSFFLDVDKCLVDYEKQVIYETSKPMNPVISLNDSIFLINEKFPSDPYNVARVMKLIPKENYSTIISTSDIRVFPAFTCDLIVNWHYRERDISIVARDKLYNSPRELIMSSMVSVIKLSQYRGHVNLVFRPHIENIVEYLSKPKNFYFKKFYDRFSGEFFQLHSVHDLIKLYRLSDGGESQYLKLLSLKAPYIFSETLFPFKEYMKFFISGENVAKNWRQQCNACFRWCNYKSNMVKCEICKEHYHLFCVSDDVNKKNFTNKSWWCKNCNDSDIKQTNDTTDCADDICIKHTKLDLLDKENFAKIELQQFKVNNYNSQNYRYQYLGFNNSECLASDFKAYITIDYWNPIKEIQVNVKKSQHMIQANLGATERGGDDTVTTIWNPLFIRGRMDKQVELTSFTNQCLINIPNLKKFSTAEVNFIDEVLKSLQANNIDFETTYNELIRKCDKQYLKIPVFTEEQLQLFEEGIKKFGGDPYKIHAHFLKDLQPLSNVVKFFYIWKKTKQGFITRGKWDKKIRQNTVKEISSNTQWVHLEKLSCYDLQEYNDNKGFTFCCKYCNCFMSPAWYKCNKKVPLMDIVNEALCWRCTKLWKNYGVEWKSFEILLKQIYGRNNWKQNLQKILIDEKFTLKLDNIIISQNIEHELLIDMMDYIKDNSRLFKDYPNVIKTYKKSCYNSKLEIDKNTWKFLNMQFSDGFEESGKKELLNYIETIEMEYSGRTRKKSGVSEKINMQHSFHKNLYSIQLKCRVGSDDYSIFITKNFNKFVLSNNNAILKSGNFCEGDISVNVSSSTALILKHFKLMHEKNTNNMISINIEDLNVIRPIECQILSVYKTAINLSLEKVNEILHSKMEFNPIREFLVNKNPSSSYRNKCSVCLQVMTLKELSASEIICNCCGMNCHYYCYGESQSATRDFNWKCDSCSFNNENSCSLCVTKETDFENCRNLSTDCTPDALKITEVSDKFVHVACALFTKGIEVSSEKFAPFRNINRTKSMISCKICDSHHGSVVKCGLCDHHFHVTCAQDENNYKFGFEKEESLAPVIVCDSHDKVHLFSLNYIYQGSSLWELYLRSIIENWSNAQGKGTYSTNSIKKCMACDNDTSLYWYRVSGDNYCCKNCHLNKIFRNVKLIQGADVNNNDLTFWDEYPIDKFYLNK
ncbi:hypothetical protein QEN19_000359 [Hanseniaspora menglaensis]